MAQHVRYADREKNERAVIRFLREDLLWRGEIAGVSWPVADGRRMIGPTILDVMARSPGADASSANWSLRDMAGFVETVPARRVTLQHDASLQLPLKASLLSGGTPILPVVIVGDFLRVTKHTTISISAYAYRLAVGTFGSVSRAHAQIVDAAAAAWKQDLERSLQLYQLIKEAADAGIEALPETPELAALRPAGSISDQVETELLKKACLALDVDPSMSIKRPPGARSHRKAFQGQDLDEAGEFVGLVDVGDATTLKIIVAVAGLTEGTDLRTLSALRLIGLLDTLTRGGADWDAALVEAFLDSHAPGWRDIAEAALTGAGDQKAGAGLDDPYQILGVSRDMPLEEIKQAYRRTRRTLHPDLSAISRWFLQVAQEAYERIEKDLEGAPP